MGITVPQCFSQILVKEHLKNHTFIPITVSISNFSSERIYNENTETACGAVTNGVSSRILEVSERVMHQSPPLWLLQKRRPFAFEVKVMPCYSLFLKVQQTTICSLLHFKFCWVFSDCWHLPWKLCLTGIKAATGRFSLQHCITVWNQLHLPTAGNIQQPLTSHQPGNTHVCT